MARRSRDPSESPLIIFHAELTGSAALLGGLLRRAESSADADSRPTRFQRFQTVIDRHSRSSSPKPLSSNPSWFIPKRLPRHESNRPSTRRAEIAWCPLRIAPPLSARPISGNCRPFCEESFRRPVNAYCNTCRSVSLTATEREIGCCAYPFSFRMVGLTLKGDLCDTLLLSHWTVFALLLVLRLRENNVGRRKGDHQTAATTALVVTA